VPPDPTLVVVASAGVGQYQGAVTRCAERDIQAQPRIGRRMQLVTAARASYFPGLTWGAVAGLHTVELGLCPQCYYSQYRTDSHQAVSPVLPGERLCSSVKLPPTTPPPPPLRETTALEVRRDGALLLLAAR
jgi:hypothetical protein